MSLLVALILLGIFGLVMSLIIVTATEKVSGFKIMLLGINITLFGGIIALDGDDGIAILGYLIAITGLIFSFVGIRKND